MEVDKLSPQFAGKATPVRRGSFVIQLLLLLTRCIGLQVSSRSQAANTLPPKHCVMLLLVDITLAMPMLTFQANLR